MNDIFTHCAFSDESGHNTGRYRSIGMISMPFEELGTVENDLLDICIFFGIKNLKNLKWAKLKNNKKHDCAQGIIEYIVQKAIEEKIRVDVLVWDTDDSRHKIMKRDDVQNLQRMYYHLMKNVFIERWPGINTWKVCPDQNCALDWEGMALFLEHKSLVTEIERSDKYPRLTIQLKNRCVLDIKEGVSSKNILIQVADLFAGMARYSRANYATFEEWSVQRSSQSQLIPTSISLSNADQHRCSIINDFNSMCKFNKLGVSLRSSRGFKTFNPKNRINFWFYNPQSDEDKAPTHG